MGVYSALTAGGSIEFGDGIQIVVNAYRCAKESFTQKQGAMYFIIGLQQHELQEIIQKSQMQEHVEISNENSQYCMTISGLKAEAEAVAEMALDEGALKAVRINTSFPFHSRLAEEASEKFGEYLKKINIKKSKYPLVSCIDQKIFGNEVNEIKNELIFNLKSKISWQKTVEKAAKIGVNSFIEVGLGESLCRISKEINRKFEFKGYEKLFASMERGAEFVQ